MPCNPLILELVQEILDSNRTPEEVCADHPELLWEVLTGKRWELLKVLCGAGPVSIREAARRVGRDVKAVHGDITALLEAGVLTRAPDGRIAVMGSVWAA